MSEPIVFIPTVTSDGEAAAFNASSTGLELALTHVSFGTGAYTPTGAESALQNEVKRVTISGGSRVNPTQIRMLSIWNDDPDNPASNSSPIYEVGFWADDVLFSVWSRVSAEPMGYKTPGVDFVLFNDLTFSQLPASSITVTVDPDGSAALAALSAHETAMNAHPQYLLRRDVPQDSGSLAWCGLATGSANALTLTLVDDEAMLTSYEAGQRFQFMGAVANTGPITANIEGLGAVAVKKAGDEGLVDLEDGDIKPGAILDLNFDGTYFQLGGGVGGGGQAFEKFPYTASVGQKIFAAAYTVGQLIVIQNGRVLDSSDYFATNGTSVELKVAATLDDSVIIVAYRPFKVANTYTKAEIDALMALHGGLPVGFMAPMPVNYVAPGWLELDGSVKSIAVYPDLYARIGTAFNTGGEAAGFFRLPDSRGEFFRGWDHGRGIDSGRALGSQQQATIVSGQAGGNPTSTSPANFGADQKTLWNAEPVSSVPTGITMATSANNGQVLTPIAGNLAHVRPRNLAVMWCIKAFAAPINQGMIDIAALASLVSQLEARQRSIGDGQNRQNLSSSRFANTVYTNNTGRSIEVSIGVADGGGAGVWTVAVGAVTYNFGNPPGGVDAFTFTVLAGETYGNVALNGNIIQFWTEVRT